MLTKSCVDKYLIYCHNLTPKTRQIYQEHLTRLTQQLDNPPLTTITRWDMINFMAALKRKNGQPYAPGYLHQIYRTLHTFFEFCAREGWLITNPMHGVPKPKLNHGPKARLTMGQIEQLYRAINQTCLHKRNMAIILLMVDSGLRLGEVVNLRLCDLRPDDKTIYIHHGKGAKTREVPISPAIEAALDQYLKCRPRPKNAAEPVFLTRDKEPITDRAIHLLLKRLEKKCGFKLHAHLLRHTFANHYNRVGNIKKLQKILGHSRASTTADYYTDPDMADIIAEYRHAAPSEQMKHTPRG